MSQPVRVLLRVRYSECDPQEVVFNVKYAEYVDVAITEYFRDVFGGYEKLIAQEIDMQVVRLVLEWKSSVGFDDILAIDVEMKHIGRTSYSFQFTFSEFYSGRLVAQAEAVYVMVSLHKHEKTPIPDWVRQALETGGSGKILNYAGIDLTAKQ